MDRIPFYGGPQGRSGPCEGLRGGWGLGPVGRPVESIAEPGRG